jgi:ABC-type sulfate transport system permease component
MVQMRERPSFANNLIAGLLSVIVILLIGAAYWQTKGIAFNSPTYLAHAKTAQHIQLAALVVALINLTFIVAVTWRYKQRQWLAEHRGPRVRVRHIILCLPFAALLVISVAGLYELRCVPVTDPTFARHSKIGIHILQTLPIAVLAQVVVSISYRLKGNERRRREDEGLCAICGYDLRATPGQCPECGNAHVAR